MQILLVNKLENEERNELTSRNSCILNVLALLYRCLIISLLGSVYEWKSSSVSVIVMWNSI